jgi:3-oxoacyl-[acyl-carrier protein] reductase
MPDPAPFSLTDRVTLVSGASSDMGDAIARQFARAGARVVLADVAEAGMERTRAALADEGIEAPCRVIDVTQRDEVEAAVDFARDRFGRLDVMANIAGIIHDARVVDMDEADLDRVLAVNLKGVFFGCQAAARVMLEQGSGSIINMASSGGFVAIPMLAGYSMSKAGVVALTRVLAAEVGDGGVRVNAVAPGYVEGGMTRRHVRDAEGGVDEEKLEALRARTRRRNPLGVTGLPEDIANAFLFLASDASRYLTGQVIHANGGAYMP